MLLAIDVGNTNTVFGLYDLASERLVTNVRASTRRDRMPDEWYAILEPALRADSRSASDITAVILSSVVPSVTTWLTAMAREKLHVDPVLVSIDLDLGIGVRVETPSEVGSDRLVNSVAALARYGAPAIVIDFGTATNFDVISADGDYVGGAIAPGLVIALEALAGRAARLFAVELKLPERAIGTNTVTSMQSGLVLGYLAMLEGMIDRIQAELGEKAAVIVTGGYADIFTGASARIDHFDPTLTIDGLCLVYQRLFPDVSQP
jgi:type III pantothenate kinase